MKLHVQTIFAHILCLCIYVAAQNSFFVGKNGDESACYQGVDGHLLLVECTR